MGVAKAGKKFKNLIQPDKDSKLSSEGILSKEELEDSRIVVPIVLPVSVRHRDLVKIREERCHETVGGTV